MSQLHQIILSPEHFIAAGYRKSSIVYDKDACASFQKLFSDEKGRRYFVNVNVHDFGDVKSHFRYIYSLSVNFDSVQDMDGFSAHFGLCSDHEVEKLTEIEKSIELLWTKIGSPYYELK
jgi:hypothetical protein